MDLKQIASFVKLEHTLFSLPFVFIGAFLAHDSGYDVSLQDLFWILIAAVGARGLAMTLNLIIDRKKDLPLQRVNLQPPDNLAFPFEQQQCDGPYRLL